jgi:hypothetical protein
VGAWIARSHKSELIHTNGIKAHLLGGRRQFLWKPVVWHVRDFPPWKG